MFVSVCVFVCVFLCVCVCVENRPFRSSMVVV